jgi:uncharacterized coiled-coil protein SlyX
LLCPIGIDNFFEICKAGFGVLQDEEIDDVEVEFENSSNEIAIHIDYKLLLHFNFTLRLPLDESGQDMYIKKLKKQVVEMQDEIDKFKKQVVDMRDEIDKFKKLDVDMQDENDKYKRLVAGMHDEYKKLVVDTQYEIDELRHFINNDVEYLCYETMPIYGRCNFCPTCIWCNLCLNFTIKSMCDTIDFTVGYAQNTICRSGDNYAKLHFYENNICGNKHEVKQNLLPILKNIKCKTLNISGNIPDNIGWGNLPNSIENVKIINCVAAIKAILNASQKTRFKKLHTVDISCRIDLNFLTQEVINNLSIKTLRINNCTNVNVVSTKTCIIEIY